MSVVSVWCNSAADFLVPRLGESYMEKKNQDQANGSGDVAGWARVPGRCGWKPTIGMYVLALSRYCHICVVCSIYLLDCRR